jgi:hypothetical protein
MSESAARDESDEPPLWQVVSLDDYDRPEQPAREAVRKGLLSLFRGNEAEAPREPFITDEGLHPLPEDLLERAAPWPDWHGVVPALDRALPGFPGSDGSPPRAQILIGAPYSGVRETVRCWAEHHGWPIVEPPTPERILAQDEGWLESITAQEGPPVVIAELEHCLLRHPLGLGFVRRLLDALHRSPRPCLIAANSWAWAYLEAAIQIGDGLAPPITFQAFDAERLARWFRCLQRFEEPAVFCRAEDGSLLLSTTKGLAEGSRSDEEPTKSSTDFTRRLAGYSRGIAGVAWALWRRSLGVANPPNAEAHRVKLPGDFPGRVIYVRPWSRIDFRALPARTGLPELFLLQALLIHGGLPEPILTEVLPNIGSSGSSALRKLAAQGIVERHQGRWQVTPLGYPVTREALAGEGLFVDSL